MKTKVSDLTGPALDWAVAKTTSQRTGKCENRPLSLRGLLLDDNEDPSGIYSPTTNWAQGGPIIEREKISLRIEHDGWWRAANLYTYDPYNAPYYLAESPLVAAMRCYVTATLGNDIEIPEELSE